MLGGEGRGEKREKMVQEKGGMVVGWLVAGKSGEGRGDSRLEMMWGGGGVTTSTGGAETMPSLLAGGRWSAQPPPEIPLIPVSPPGEATVPRWLCWRKVLPYPPSLYSVLSARPLLEA